MSSEFVVVVIRLFVVFIFLVVVNMIWCLCLMIWLVKVMRLELSVMVCRQFMLRLIEVQFYFVLSVECIVQLVIVFSVVDSMLLCMMLIGLQWLGCGCRVKIVLLLLTEVMFMLSNVVIGGGGSWFVVILWRQLSLFMVVSIGRVV